MLLQTPGWSASLPYRHSLLIHKLHTRKFSKDETGKTPKIHNHSSSTMARKSHRTEKQIKSGNTIHMIGPVDTNKQGVSGHNNKKSNRCNISSENESKKQTTVHVPFPCRVCKHT